MAVLTERCHLIHPLGLQPSSRNGKVAAHAVVAVLLYAGAAAALMDSSGYAAVTRVLGGVRWPWVGASAAGVAAAFAGG